jgi:hypothetical protein
MQAALGKGPLGGVFNDLIGVSSGGITGLFSGASSGGAAAASGGSSFLPPGFARGGVAKGMAIVGENGPELINVGSPSRVFSNASSNHMIGNSAPVVVNINNTSGAEITAQQSGPNLEILVEQAVSRSISQGTRQSDNRSSSGNRRHGGADNGNVAGVSPAIHGNRVVGNAAAGLCAVSYGRRTA